MRTIDLPERPLIDPTTAAIDDRALEAWMIAYAAGDREAWEPLFRLLAPRVLAFFRRSLQDPGSAETYTQATFVELHRARRRYARGTPVRRWVFAIATRLRIDHASRAPDANRASHVSGSGENSRACQVRSAIESLSDSDRAVIHLHRFERMNFEEIAEVLGWTEAAVRECVSHAYQQLRERLWSLSDDGEGP